MGHHARLPNLKLIKEYWRTGGAGVGHTDLEAAMDRIVEAGEQIRSAGRRVQALKGQRRAGSILGREAASQGPRVPQRWPEPQLPCYVGE